MLNDKQRKQIIEMYGNGEKVEVIAMLVGCRNDEVSKTAIKAGMRRTSRCKFLKSRDEAIANDYLSGVKMLAISERHGLDVSNIYRALRREGVKERRLPVKDKTDHRRRVNSASVCGLSLSKKEPLNRGSKGLTTDGEQNQL